MTAGSVFRLPVSLDEVILLAALAAEGDGQQDLVPITRHELLAVNRDMSNIRIFDGCKDVFAAADKLVNAEGECRHPVVRSFTCVSGKQASLYRSSRCINVVGSYDSSEFLG